MPRSLVCSRSSWVVCCSLTSCRFRVVSELNLPHDRKTIKPDKRLGGVAGGLKYIVQNILFKFALDTPRPQRTLAAQPPPHRAPRSICCGAAAAAFVVFSSDHWVCCFWC